MYSVNIALKPFSVNGSGKSAQRLDRARYPAGFNRFDNVRCTSFVSNFAYILRFCYDFCAMSSTYRNMTIMCNRSLFIFCRGDCCRKKALKKNTLDFFCFSWTGNLINHLREKFPKLILNSGLLVLAYWKQMSHLVILQQNRFKNRPNRRLKGSGMYTVLSPEESILCKKKPALCAPAGKDQSR